MQRNCSRFSQYLDDGIVAPAPSSLVLLRMRVSSTNASPDRSKSFTWRNEIQLVFRGNFRCCSNSRGETYKSPGDFLSTPGGSMCVPEPENVFVIPDEYPVRSVARFSGKNNPVPAVTLYVDVLSLLRLPVDQHPHPVQVGQQVSVREKMLFPSSVPDYDCRNQRLRYRRPNP